MLALAVWGSALLMLASLLLSLRVFTDSIPNAVLLAAAVGWGVGLFAAVVAVVLEARADGRSAWRTKVPLRVPLRPH